jgi:multiple sugar transport system permease protein
METKINTYNKINKYIVQRNLTIALKYFILTAISVVYMIPIIWMISTSLKARADIFAWPPMLFPSVPKWENYRIAFESFPLLRFMGNSMTMVLLNILGELLAVPLVAYGFARLRFPGKNFLFMLVLATMMIPAQIKLIPLYKMYSSWGMLDTYVPLVLHSFFGGAFFIFLVVQYIRTTPTELDDAGRIDGLGSFGILYRIILPMITPVLVLIVIYTFLWTWNEFLNPIIYLTTFEKFPIQVGLNMFKGRFDVQWNLFMAATFASIFPVLFLYFFVQKRLIGGIASVGIKG